MTTWTRRDEHLVVVLPRGTDILEGLLGAVREAEIVSGAFTGLGAIEDPELAYFDRDARVYNTHLFPGVWEIASLTGNLTQFGGQPRLHCHAVISGPDCAARAGHLAGGRVGVTCEIVLTPFASPLLRRIEPAFELPLIVL